MSKPKNTTVKVCVSRFAAEYGVSVVTFKNWIAANPTLKEAFEPYMNELGIIIKKSLPPSIETIVYTVLGEP